MSVVTHVIIAFLSDDQMKDSLWRQQDITVMAMVLLVILLIIFIIGMAVLCVKFQRSRRSTKKLELVAQCNNQSLCHQTPVFTIQSSKLLRRFLLEMRPCC